jgi:hypothetical protein
MDNMEYKKLPTTFIYENIVELPNMNPFYKLYKFTGLHKNKYETHQFKALVFNKTYFSRNLFNKYNSMMKNLDHVPSEFLLGENKMFKSSELMNIMEKPMIIVYHNDKTLEDYLNEIKEFVDTNKNNNINYKRNHSRILSNCQNALKKLHTLGFCYTKLNVSHFSGNYNLSDIYLQKYEQMFLCDDKKHKKQNMDDLKKIFSFYKL